jgi:acyl-coenzyme A thioesterase PaaI-like protein
MSATPPAGFTPMPHQDGYIGLSGPFYVRGDAASGFDYGFQSDHRHGNPNGVLHGAAIVAFIDTLLGHAVVMATGRMCATVALDNQFVAGVPTGGWISGRARIKKLTRMMAFLEAEASAGDTLLLTSTAIFRIFENR